MNDLFIFEVAICDNASSAQQEEKKKSALAYYLCLTGFMPVQQYSNDSLGLLNSLPTVLDMPPFCYIINSKSGKTAQAYRN